MRAAALGAVVALSTQAAECGTDLDAMPDEPTEVVLDFDELERKPAPVPYWSAADAGIRHDRHETLVPFPDEPAQVGILATGSEPRYALATREPGPLLAIDADGTTEPISEFDAQEFVQSPDRNLIGWMEDVEPEGPGGSFRLQVVDLTSGEVTIDQGSLGHGAKVIGFLADGAILAEHEAGGSGDVDVFGRDEPRGRLGSFTTAPDEDLVAVWAEDHHVDWLVENGFVEAGSRQPDRCGMLTRVGEDEPRWVDCDQLPVALTPDGRRMVAWPASLDDESAYSGPAVNTIIDVDSGRPLVEIHADRLYRVAWTDEGDEVVIEAQVGDELALVTCDLDGACWLSTDPAPYDPFDPPNLRPAQGAPYLLASPRPR